MGLIKEKKFNEALGELGRAIVLRPAFAIALIARGSARIGLGQYQDAVADYTAARAADPTRAAPVFGLAECYRALGEPAKAALYYREFAASSAPDAEPQLKEYAQQNAQALAPR